MLDFLSLYKEKLFYKKFLDFIDTECLYDASAIKSCIDSKWCEDFDSFDSDVCEQFITCFEDCFITNEKFNNYKLQNRFIVVAKRGNEFGVLDIYDSTIEFYNKDRLISIVRSGILIDGVNITNNIVKSVN